MEGNKPRLFNPVTGVFILLIVVMGIVLTAESIFIIAQAGMFSDIFSDITPVSPSKVAVIYVEGELITDNIPDGLGYASSNSIVKHLRKAEEDKSIKAIVLRINSPGGTPVAAQEIYRQINKTSQVKPIVVSMGDIATSAAYYISAPCTKIVANPDTFTGSIGVIWTFENKSGLYEKEGIQYYVAKSGPYKDVGADWRGLNENEKAYVNNIINQSYSRFVDAVASGRHMDREEVQRLADGRVYTGYEARDLGLVDDLGGMYEAIDIAAELGNISGKPEVTYVNDPSLYELLFGSEAMNNVSMREGYYQPYYSPYGRIYA
ncbi:signal peptide peptidase SppA [Methanocella arvoryzae]|uniref:Periplasmic serine protease n=1 Tax=Methanocella arvoryzae (strain DSM 22066 / NBRC 105507 / MRE50) TaxID=351160 RepID=Q0W770_METAR|nr:signal peptide peptidase SppA [Methanocella arvoryzae]CAJ35773.1 putative periplasmic serine protease [Methanocella arvoryzae MRE50]